MTSGGNDVPWDDPAYTQPPPARLSVGSVFAWLYVVWILIAAGGWIWATTVPGSRFWSGLVSAMAILLAGVVWTVLVAVAVVRLLRRRIRRPGWLLAVYPAVGAVLALSSVTALPARARFELVRSDFDRYAKDVLAEVDAAGGPGLDPRRVEQDAPSSIGGVGVAGVRVLPEGVVIFDDVGDGLDDAGYAYLPEGRFPPGDGAFESPSFRSLGGGWYAFTSSW